MGGRAVYGNGLENRRIERYRGFKSLPIRQNRVLDSPKQSKESHPNRWLFLLFSYEVVRKRPLHSPKQSVKIQNL